MSFLYPRLVSVSRPTGPTGAGYVGYSGVNTSTETPVIANVPANIQAKTTLSRSSGGALPAAPPGPIVWRVFIPLNAVPKGTIKDRDIITDDEGNRFVVEASYWNSMGWNLATIRLEAR